MLHLYAPLTKVIYIDCAVHSPIHTPMAAESIQGTNQHTGSKLGTFRDLSSFQRRFLYPEPLSPACCKGRLDQEWNQRCRQSSKPMWYAPGLLGQPAP